jgi:hypothetical protein
LVAAGFLELRLAGRQYQASSLRNEAEQFLRPSSPDFWIEEVIYQICVTCQEKNEMFLHRLRFLGKVVAGVDVAPRMITSRAPSTQKPSRVSDL